MAHSGVSAERRKLKMNGGDLPRRRYEDCEPPGIIRAAFCLHNAGSMAGSLQIQQHGMANEFPFDVFLSHSATDKAVVRFPSLSASNGERVGVRCRGQLQQDGVRVWLDEEQLPSLAGAGEGGRRPGEGREAKADSIPAKIEAGLEHSRVLVLCMSANAFGSDWAQLGELKLPLTTQREIVRGSGRLATKAEVLVPSVALLKFLCIT